MIKKVVVQHKNNRNVYRYCILTDGTLYLYGNFERWWGFPSSYDIQKAIRYENELTEMEKKVLDRSAGELPIPYKKALLKPEEEKRKLEILRDIAYYDEALQKGEFAVVQSLIKKKCFWQMDDYDITACSTFLQNYVNANKQEADKEFIIHGWPVLKINFRYYYLCVLHV